MVIRSYWNSLLKYFWRQKPITWITGVRQSGKTALCQIYPEAEFFDCEMPRVRRLFADPNEFWGKLKGKKVVLDEIHRLSHPLDVLAASAVYSPPSRIIVTAPVSPPINQHLPDSLKDRISQVWLTPMMSLDLFDFGNPALAHRFLRGGLPPFFLSPQLRESDYQGWMDSFWAKDVQALFRIERRDSFQQFMELLFARSGELFEAVRYSGPCGVSRTTITKYLAALEATSAILVIRPYSTRKPVEIVTAPKTYAFDTGFFCFFRGGHELREEDYPTLWKHWVLNETCSRFQALEVQYWRNKRGQEVDFVLVTPTLGIVALDCRWKAGDFESGNLQAFRRHYPEGPNWVVCGDVVQGYVHNFGKMKAEFLNLEEMVKRLSAGEKPDGKEIDTDEHSAAKTQSKEPIAPELS